MRSFRESSLPMAIAAGGVVLVTFMSLIGCDRDEATIDASSVGSEVLRDQANSRWGYDEGGVKARYVADAAEVLEGWWLELGGREIATIEIEGPRLEFVLEDEGVQRSQVVRFAIEPGERFRYNVTFLMEIKSGDQGGDAGQSSVNVQARVLARPVIPKQGVVSYVGRTAKEVTGWDARHSYGFTTGGLAVVKQGDGSWRLGELSFGEGNQRQIRLVARAQ